MHFISRTQEADISLVQKICEGDIYKADNSNPWEHSIGKSEPLDMISRMENLSTLYSPVILFHIYYVYEIHKYEPLYSFWWSV